VGIGLLLLVVAAGLGCSGEVTAGDAGGGSGASPGARRPSCAAEAPGADSHCGAAGDIDCCGWAEVSGGTYHRLNSSDDGLLATVSSFRLDLFEVTMGRFRQFLAAYPGSLPAPGQGAHPRHPESGWQPQWNDRVPPDRQSLSESMMNGDLFGRPCFWDPQPGGHDRVPVECVSWFIAFAFCAWDGGRLPSFTEWNYAAAGGDEQRTYPWGEQPYDPSRAVYGDTPNGVEAEAGSAPAGRTRWGQYDFGGSRVEWNLDYGTSSQEPVAGLPKPCDDCVLLTPKVDDWRSSTDSNYLNTLPYPVVTEPGGAGNAPDENHLTQGLRCVYTPPDE